MNKMNKELQFTLSIVIPLNNDVFIMTTWQGLKPIFFF